MEVHGTKYLSFPIPAPVLSTVALSLMQMHFKPLHLKCEMDGGKAAVGGIGVHAGQQRNDGDHFQLSDAH